MAKPFQIDTWDVIALIARRAKSIAFIVENAPPAEIPLDMLSKHLLELATLHQELRDKIAAMPRVKPSAAS